MAKRLPFHKKPREPQGLVLAFLAGDSVWQEASDAPEAAWEAIVALSERELAPKQIALLAAGPLEELLATHGNEFIDRAEARARRYRRFRHLLGGVWQHGMEQCLWDRIVNCRGTAW